MSKVKEKVNGQWSFRLKRLLPVLLLSGCSLMIGNFDPVEYSYINRIRTQAQLLDCSKQSVIMMSTTALELKNYSQYLPDNEQEYNLIIDLYKLINGLKQIDNPSSTYCKAKLDIIETTAEKLQQVTGNKPR